MLKPADLGTSYPPISLICPAFKVLESLLYAELNLLPFSITQLGFRLNHSTASAHPPLAHNIARGFNQLLSLNSMLTMAIDFSKGCWNDQPHQINFLFILSSLSNTKRWLSACLKGRIANSWYNFTNSSSCHDRIGIPQSYCLSPALFNFFLPTFSQSGNWPTHMQMTLQTPIMNRAPSFRPTPFRPTRFRPIQLG